MTLDGSKTGALVERAGSGDDLARQELLARYRSRLCQMVALRLDRRLAARVDPSDVVQEALLDAAQQIDDYLQQPPLPFYPWLRQFAWDRLIDLHRWHLHARRRSVAREEPSPLHRPDESAVHLAECLTDGGTSPSRNLLREELRQRVRAVLGKMAAHDREILVMRYLEQLSTAEVAAMLGISVGAVKSRHMRALLRLRSLLDEDHPKGPE